ncbi:MAG: KamA family radical SAM protein [Verrucomicrobia bacterium]|nr:KamA family radical SAM protein [Verrucomicrobiota bacterium]
MLWRQILRTNFRQLSMLADFLELDPSSLSKNPRFPLNLPRRIANKINKADLNDPLLRQFVPLAEEQCIAEGFVDDPVQDVSFCRSKKLLQKYEGRALLLTTSTCAMNCRFCFRKNFDYEQKTPFDQEIAHIQGDSSLQEIILSGGDPLSLSDTDLKQLFDRIGAIEHVKIIRFHTRFPVGIPERINESFLQILVDCPKQIVFILHSNHPKELDPDVLSALKSIQKQGIPLLLQTVLLKGVNDSLETLKALFEKCIHNGILPYYLHQLDRVEGSAHMEVPEERGKELIKELRSCLPGYAIPTYVAEIPGKPNKTVLF